MGLLASSSAMSATRFRKIRQTADVRRKTVPDARARTMTKSPVLSEVEDEVAGSNHCPIA